MKKPRQTYLPVAKLISLYYFQIPQNQYGKIFSIMLLQLIKYAVYYPHFKVQVFYYYWCMKYTIRNNFNPTNQIISHFTIFSMTKPNILAHHLPLIKINLKIRILLYCPQSIFLDLIYFCKIKLCPFYTTKFTQIHSRVKNIALIFLT